MAEMVSFMFYHNLKNEEIKKPNSWIGRHLIGHISSVLVNLVFFSLQFILRGYWDDKKCLLVIDDGDSDHDDAIVLLIHK